MKAKNHTGKKFNRLRGIRCHRKYEHGGYVWLWLCDCGRVVAKPANDVISGNSKSCGCWFKEFQKNRLRKTESAINIVLYQYKRNAKTNNRSFSLIKDDFIFLINQNCHYCGSKPHYTLKNYDSFYYNGIDRINSDLGYSIENCVTCCYICNRAKNNMEYNDFLNWINKLKQYTFDEVRSRTSES